MYFTKSKKDPMVQKYKNVEIYLNLDRQIFYATDGITGETWEDERIYRIIQKIDEPLWETCDLSYYGAQKGYNAINKIHASRRCVRTRKPEWKVVAVSSSDRHSNDIGQVWEDRWGKITIYPINEHNDKMFEKVKELSQEVTNMERLRDEIAVKSLIK